MRGGVAVGILMRQMRAGGHGHSASEAAGTKRRASRSDLEASRSDLEASRSDLEASRSDLEAERPAPATLPATVRAVILMQVRLLLIVSHCFSLLLTASHCFSLLLNAF